MSNIDLKRFVNIDITSHVTPSVQSSRDTVVLFTADTTETHNIVDITLNNNAYHANLVDITNYKNIYTSTSQPNTLAYLNVYFNNGGIKALVIENMPIATLSAAEIADLDNKYILIAYAAPTTSLETVYNALRTIASTRNSISSIYGINEKIIIGGTSASNDTDLIKNFAVKYTTTQGGEMTIPAYLCKINVRGNNTVHDYAFTTENIAEQNITDSLFETLMNNNYNVDIDLANAVRNAGGNCKDGSDLTNSYVKIILHQTLTDTLINLLTEKLKNSTGLAKIYSAISEELEKYLNCGYLTTDKVWTDDDYKITTKNNIEYTIIEKGTPLLKGYSITILPMSSLTSEEKAAHSTPSIYVIIADQYGIRKITINGEVI